MLALSKSRKNVERSKIPEGRESPEALRGMGGEQDPLKPGTAPEGNGQKWSKFGKMGVVKSGEDLARPPPGGLAPLAAIWSYAHV